MDACSPHLTSPTYCCPVSATVSFLCTDNIVPFYSCSLSLSLALSESIQWHFHLNIQFKPIHWPNGWWFHFGQPYNAMQKRIQCLCCNWTVAVGSFRSAPLRTEPQKQTFNSKLFDRKEIEFQWNFVMVLLLQLLPSSINKILGTLIYYRRNCIFAGPTSCSVCNKNSWKYCNLSVLGAAVGLGCPNFPFPSPAHDEVVVHGRAKFICWLATVEGNWKENHIKN